MLVKFTRFPTCLLAPHQYISHSYKKEFIVALLSELSPKEGPPYVRSVLPFSGPGSNRFFQDLLPCVFMTNMFRIYIWITFALFLCKCTNNERTTMIKNLCISNEEFIMIIDQRRSVHLSITPWPSFIRKYSRLSKVTSFQLASEEEGSPCSESPIIISFWR